MTEPAPRRPAVVSSPELLRAARTAQGLQVALEVAVGLVVAGSVVAIGSVHVTAYTTLWTASFAAFGLTLVRALILGGLRDRLGPRRASLHASGRWLVLDPTPDDPALGWTVDLAADSLPRTPLLMPALAFLALALLQLVPMRVFEGPISVAPEATQRGITFVLAFLLLHETAAAAFTRPGARRRFRLGLAALGTALAVAALAQLASRTHRVYGVFEPLEGGVPFGSFVSRNHFAGYMLLVLPIALGLLHEARRSGSRRRVILTALPVFLGTVALIASSSRGGTLAFAAAVAIAFLAVRSSRGTPGWTALLVVLAAAFVWLGLERHQLHVLRPPDYTEGRMSVWREARGALSGVRWATGYGLNTFAVAVSRVPAWALPLGATPWPETAEVPLRSGARVGYRTPVSLREHAWYREAHNDYLQVLVETGVPGLLLALWAAFSVLASARRDPWLFAALAGVLMHVCVDFDLQIPAISALFVVLAALGSRANPAPVERARRRGAPEAPSRG